MERLNKDTFLGRVFARRASYHDGYYAMYSSEWDAVVTDPELMLIPLDDHMVHRGDGIFEMFSCVDGALFDYQAHLDRLQYGANHLKLELPMTLERLTECVLETVRMGEARDCSVRIFLSRGPGSFGVNPYDCPTTQIYITASAPAPDFMKQNPGGARVETSRVPVKPSMFATVKSCDYLMNAMMKMQAVDSGVHFVIGEDEEGYLTEGATENLGLVKSDGRLVFPDLGRVLRGTSMVRISRLAETLLPEGLIEGVAFEKVTREDVLAAREVYVLGTSPGIVPVVEYDGQPINGGGFGPVYQRLRGLLEQEIRAAEDLRTPVFEG